MPLGRRFWIVRTLTVYGGVFGLLYVVSLLKGRTPSEALSFAALWALASTAIFIGSRYYHASRGRVCALCRDTPEPAPHRH
jgi:hypothetical protein